MFTIAGLGKTPDTEVGLIVQNRMVCSLFGMAILECDMHSVDQQQHTWPRQQGYRQ